MRIVFFLCLLSVLCLTACSTNAGSQAEGEVVPTAKEPVKKPDDDGFSVRATLFAPEIECKQKETKEGYEVECTVVRKRTWLSEWAEVEQQDTIRATGTFPSPLEPRDGTEKQCPDLPGWMCFCWGDACYPIYPM